MKGKMVKQSPVAPIFQARFQPNQMRMKGETRKVTSPNAIRKKTSKRTLDLPERRR